MMMEESCTSSAVGGHTCSLQELPCCDTSTCPSTSRGRRRAGAHWWWPLSWCTSHCGCTLVGFTSGLNTLWDGVWQQTHLSTISSFNPAVITLGLCLVKAMQGDAVGTGLWVSNCVCGEHMLKFTCCYPLICARSVTVWSCRIIST